MNARKEFLLHVCEPGNTHEVIMSKCSLKIKLKEKKFFLLKHFEDDNSDDELLPAENSEKLKPSGSTRSIGDFKRTRHFSLKKVDGISPIINTGIWPD